MTPRTAKGAMAHHAGRAAEHAVERRYVAQGYTLATRRYKTASGEIDLVFRLGSDVIFVEVKQASSLDRAAQALSHRQLSRIHDAATAFLGGEPFGQDTPSRVDVALMDATGHVEVLENVMAA